MKGDAPPVHAVDSLKTRTPSTFSSEVWITVKRTPGDDRIKEHYSVFRRLMIGSHKL